MPEPTYRLESRTRDDSATNITTIPFRRATFSRALNGPGGIDFSINLTDPAATVGNLDPGNTVLRLWRQSGNLLTKNQSDAETDTAGFGGFAAATISRVTSVAWQGLSSIQAVTPGSIADEGVATGTTFAPVVAGAQYTGSVYVRASSPSNLALTIRWRTAGGAFIADLVGPATAVTTAWVRLSVTGIAPATAASVAMRVTTTSAQARTFQTDGWQLEPGPVATAFDQGSAAAEVRVWTGYLWACRVNGRDELECSGEGLYSILRHRYIQADLVYLATGQATIARNLISYTNGRAPTLISFGTDAGANTARSVAYCGWERRLVSDAIEELALADDGYDFEVTPTGQWNTYQPRKGTDLSAAFILDGSDIDVENLDYSEDATDLATEFTATGPCESCAGDTYVAVSGGVDGTYGLHEASDHFDFRENAHVAAAGREAYRNRKVPRRAASIRIPPDTGLGFDSFALGDLVQLQLSRGWLNVNRKMRVIGQSYQLEDTLEWKVLDLDSVVA